MLKVSNNAANFVQPLNYRTAAQVAYARVRAEIAPHYDGTLPPALAAAFPNEGGEILRYRKSIYKAKTKALLRQAVIDLTRAFSGSKWAVHFESPEFEQFISSFKKDGYGLVQYITNVVYWQRVLDPNAVLLVSAKAPQTQSRHAIIKLEVISSARLISEADYLMYAPTDEERAAGVEYHIVTPEFFGYKDEKKESLTVTYEHLLGCIPATKLGGQPQMVEGAMFYESDFSAAVPYLNASVQYDNQFDAVLFSTMFPTTIVQGVVCESCNGMKRLPCEEQGQKTCSECNGAGYVQRSPLKAVMVKVQEGLTPDERAANAGVKPIEFIEPSINSAALLKDTAAEALEQARRILNIHQGLKQAQSGIAKEIDRESVLNQVMNISDYIFNVLIYNTLEYMQGIYFKSAENRGAITVNAPASLELRSHQKSITELKDSITHLPPDLRHKAYMDYVQKYYYGDPTAITVARYCTQYAPLYLYTDEERGNGLAMGVFSQIEIVKATFVHSWLLQIAAEVPIQTADYKSDILPKLDKLFEDSSKQQQIKQPIL